MAQATEIFTGRVAVDILRVGRRADLTVLSADPYAIPADQLRSLTVLQTIVSGRTTYHP